MMNKDKGRRYRKLLWIYLFIFPILTATGGGMQEDNNSINGAEERINARLSSEEVYIVVDGGTERAFTGDLLNNKETGTYICVRCKAPLYHSDSKFESGCGWPSFDDEIKGAVGRLPDGSRTEIRCASCDAHLGHVFEGEGFTDKDIRHCVNSVSMDFVPDRGETGRAIFAGGCFWGVEHLFRTQPGVLETTVGYTGGHIAYPDYRQVLSHTTGHYEAVEVLYDPELTDYETLAKYFFEIHDPTQTDGQGPDRGEQYLSVVFAENESQRETTQSLIEILKGKGYVVATRILDASAFWPAEEYHQDYYELKGTLPYCHSYTPRF